MRPPCPRSLGAPPSLCAAKARSGDLRSATRQLGLLPLPPPSGGGGGRRVLGAPPVDQFQRNSLGKRPSRWFGEFAADVAVLAPHNKGAGTSRWGLGAAERKPN